MELMVKEEKPEIVLSSDSDSDVSVDGGVGKRSRVPNGEFDEEARRRKRAKTYDLLPRGFLDPIPLTLEAAALLPAIKAQPLTMRVPPPERVSRQFWKAGEYEGLQGDRSSSFCADMDRVRVHPRFLHSNATSHKWSLGAFAELLDNSLDEVCNGATFVKVDVVDNKKDKSKMLVIEDNGGGMDPDKMRQCMSLGYSAKSKQRNTIGQYGNGFKTSTMRLGADVIVFSRSHGKDGRSPSQSIGMLSYTFLRGTGREDIVVPIIDYEKGGQDWIMSRRSSASAWTNNLETIISWSPYSSESDLLQQFNMMSDQGTLIVIYNLWEDGQGELELDFVTDKYDIQMGGANRDEANIKLAERCPNSRHFLTYRHSLRSYASILYLRLPPQFKMILRGKEIEHHNLVDDMMMEKQVTYKPASIPGVSKDQNMSAVVTVGFVKDAKDHIDIQGFNVYHKNRLIKPFWRLWNAAGSDGRGVIGVLEANFVEPAHDKQGFERTIVLQRLESRLIQMQKDFWKDNCDKIGYASRRPRKPESMPHDKKCSAETSSTRPSKKSTSPSSFKLSCHITSGSGSPVTSPSNHDVDEFASQNVGSTGNDQVDLGKLCTPLFGAKRSRHSRSEKRPAADIIGEEGCKNVENMVEPAESLLHQRSYHVNGGIYHGTECITNEIPLDAFDFADHSAQEVFHKDATVPFYSDPAINENRESNAINEREQIARGDNRSNMKAKDVTSNGNEPNLEECNHRIEQLVSENEALKNRIKEMEHSMLRELQYEKDRNKKLAEELEAAAQNLERLNNEQEALIDLFADERCRRDKEEEILRKKLKDATANVRS